MKFITLLILIFLFSTSFLNAASNYIGVTQTTNKNQLRVINSRFKTMGLKMLYKTTDRAYLIYSGPYNTSESAANAMQKIKRYFPNAKFLNAKSNKSNSSINSSIQINNKESAQKNKTGFYIGTTIGFSSAPTQIVSKSSVTIIEPNNNGMNFLIDGGYNFENSFTLTLAYMRFDTGDLVFDNIYGAINYRFKDFDSFTPYFGILGGYSSLKWGIDPVENFDPLKSNSDSTSLITGTQAGIIYNGIGNISLLVGYKCIIMGHTTNIEEDKLEHQALHTIEIGIQYNF